MVSCTGKYLSMKGFTFFFFKYVFGAAAEMGLQLRAVALLLSTEFNHQNTHSGSQPSIVGSNVLFSMLALYSVRAYIYIRYIKFLLYVYEYLLLCMFIYH